MKRSLSCDLRKNTAEERGRKRFHNCGRRQRPVLESEDQAQGAPNPNVAGRVCTVGEDADTSDLQDCHVPERRSP